MTWISLLLERLRLGPKKKKAAASAVAALANAIELDPAYRDKPKHDSDYDLIHDDADYRKLVYGE